MVGPVVGLDVGLDVVVGFVLEVLMTLLDWCMVDRSLFLAYDGSTYAMPWWAIARPLPLREAWGRLVYVVPSESFIPFAASATPLRGQNRCQRHHHRHRRRHHHHHHRHHHHRRRRHAANTASW